jgi:hypothetical protein
MKAAVVLIRLGKLVAAWEATTARRAVDLCADAKAGEGCMLRVHAHYVRPTTGDWLSNLGRKDM